MWVGYDTIIKKTSHLARTTKQGIGLKLAVLSLDYLLAKRGQRVRVDREDDKDLKTVKAPKRGLVGISRGNEG
jgi:hypothetical protein